MASTKKRDRFCDKYIECLNASEAYRYAFDCGKMSAKNIKNKAYELLNKGDVRETIEKLQGELSKVATITKESNLRRLQDIISGEMTIGGKTRMISTNDIISAINISNKMLGFETAKKVDLQVEQPLFPKTNKDN